MKNKNNKKSGEVIITGLFFLAMTGAMMLLKNIDSPGQEIDYVQPNVQPNVWYYDQLLSSQLPDNPTYVLYIRPYHDNSENRIDQIDRHLLIYNNIILSMSKEIKIIKEEQMILRKEQDARNRN